MISSHITGIIIILGTAVVLPVSIVYLYLRSKMSSDNNRKEIILAALEKDASIDIEELVRKMNKPEKLLKEKLLRKQQWGMFTMFFGIGLIGFGVYLDFANIGAYSDELLSIWGGLVMLAVGIAFLANYQIGKKMLAKEMDAEEQNLRRQS